MAIGQTMSAELKKADFTVGVVQGVGKAAAVSAVVVGGVVAIPGVGIAVLCVGAGAAGFDFGYRRRKGVRNRCFHCFAQ
jgi:hypothetical protein